MRPNIRTFFATLCAGAAVAACAADSTRPNGAGRAPVSVSFATAASLSSGSLSPADPLLATSAADAIVITKAQLVFARLELQKAGASCTGTEAQGDDDKKNEDCGELELAPTLVDLPVNASVITGLNATVPVGTYSELEAKIRPVEAKRGAGSAAFLAANPTFAGVSVRVEGTYNGKAFTYTGAPRAEVEIAFNPPLVVTEKGANITVHIDISKWFKTSSGEVIDPATAVSGGVNANLVAWNIKKSLRAFRDDDKKGRG